MSLSERVLIVEGYFDRAFVTGALKRLACASLKDAPVDPWGNKVKGSGQHAFRSASGAFIRIVPVEGSTLDRRVRLVAADAKTRAVEHLLVIPDADLSAAEDPSTKLASKRDNLCGLCGGTALPGEPRAFTAPSLVRGEVGVWACADEGSELPPKQNLERLVTAEFAPPTRPGCESPRRSSIIGRKLHRRRTASWP